MVETLLGNGAILATLIIGWLDARSQLKANREISDERHQENIRKFERIEKWITKQGG